MVPWPEPWTRIQGTVLPNRFRHFLKINELMDPVIRGWKRFQRNRTNEGPGGVNDKAAEAPTCAPNKVCVGLLRMPQGFSALITGFSVMKNKEIWSSFTCTLAPPSFRHGSGRNPGIRRTGFRLRACRNDGTARWELGCGHPH